MSPAFRHASQRPRSDCRGGATSPFTPETYQRQSPPRSQDVSAQVGNIIAPTLVIHGDADPLIRHRTAYLARYPGAAYRLPRRRHVPILECEEGLNRDTLAFLNEEDPLVAPVDETPHQKRPTKLWHWGRSDKRDSR